MSDYSIISMDDESTVVAEFTPKTTKADAYQSEATLEKEFVEQLKGQGYGYLSVSSEQELLENLRCQLEILNDFRFSDYEWSWFFSRCISNEKEGIVEKTRRIQVEHIQILKRDDGSVKNIRLIDKEDIHNNKLQVLNQYEEDGGTYKSRYDVTILVNGFPLVHVELKRRGIAIREAFNQIKRYQRDSFWASSGLFEYVQIFVISNGTNTKYYSNTTREQHIKDNIEGIRKSKKKTSNSFEFTSCWADAKNNVISDLGDFTSTFFAKHSILNILTKFSVFTSEDLLLVMRPYQIVATEKILLRIKIANNYKTYGSIDAGGYVWHTTGSGKTLTSFKTAQLATKLSYVDKVLFVVDRRDLDYQTMKEYDRFEKGAANGNTSTGILKKQLENDSSKIIITTIQKLDWFIRNNKTHSVFHKHIVLIFDECHRSQFGGMHKSIAASFRNYFIFGFTGTPISAKNMSSGANPQLRTTRQVFGDELHAYTIVNAIRDGNVLPFRIDYFKTAKMANDVQDEKVPGIDTEPILASPERIREIVQYTLEHFNQKTKRNEPHSHYEHRVIDNVADMEASKHNKIKERKSSKKLSGFNAIFAVSNSFTVNGKRISPIQLYYDEFKRQLNETGRNLRIAAIFSFTPNEETADEDFDNNKLDDTSRSFLDAAIEDYNEMFGVNYDSSADKFQNYYKDLSLRMKNREIDLLIVVNMFLTGFDATTLNTLWVDKNLKYHGLIQAFSRTNRILNSVKTFGNIVCFRNLKTATDEALSLFGDETTSGIVLLKTYSEYYNGYEEDGVHKPGYIELIENLTTSSPLESEIIGEENQKDFIRLFGAILRQRNVLSAFDDFLGNEILSERDFQDYQSKYIDLYQSYNKKTDAEKVDISNDVVFEIELIKQIEVNIDYILLLVLKYHKSNCKDKTIITDIQKAIDSSIELRSKRSLIESFIATINAESDVNDDWDYFVHSQKEIELGLLIEEEKLKQSETERLMEYAFNNGNLKTTGTDIDKILPPVSRFSKDNNRVAKKQTVIEKLLALFEKYSGVV